MIFMVNISWVLAFLLAAGRASAAVVGAGDLAWEMFYENAARVLKYNRESLDQDKRSYQSRVWFYTRFKQPYASAETDFIPIKYVFQHVVFDCMNKTYKQTEFLVYDWENEEIVAHLLTESRYQIISGSPIDRLWGLSCTYRNKY